jgi:hypothetical protein
MDWGWGWDGVRDVIDAGRGTLTGIGYAQEVAVLRTIIIVHTPPVRRTRRAERERLSG